MANRRVLNIRDILYHYLQHQIEVIRRRTEFDLKKAEASAHILEGLRIALDHLDEVIELIRASQTAEIARDGLISRFNLTYEQAQAILICVCNDLLDSKAKRLKLNTLN